MTYRIRPVLSDRSRNGPLNLAFPPKQAQELARQLLDHQTQYKTADQAFTSNGTLANDADFSFSLLEGGVYTFEFHYFVSSTTNGGCKLDLDGGTATATFVRAVYKRVEAAAIASSNVSALATDSTGDTANTEIIISGSIQVNAPGTFIPRIAQNTSHADTTTYQKGSWGRVVRLGSVN